MKNFISWISFLIGSAFIVIAVKTGDADTKFQQYTMINDAMKRIEQEVKA